MLSDRLYLEEIRPETSGVVLWVRGFGGFGFRVWDFVYMVEGVCEKGLHSLRYLMKCAGMIVSLLGPCSTHRPQSSSFLGFIFSIL